MTSEEQLGSWKFEPWMFRYIGTTQIYSPSGLYSILLHKDVVEKRHLLSPHEVFLLNNSNLTVYRYKFNHVMKKIQSIYWLTDTILVCLMNSKENILQISFDVDHKSCSANFRHCREFHYGKNTKAFRELACVTLNKIDYIVWYTLREKHYCLLLIPKDPFSTGNSRKYYVKIGFPQGMEFLNEIVNENGTIGAFKAFGPVLSHKNKLLSPMACNGQPIFGVYAEIDIAKLVDVSENRQNPQEILAEQAEDAVRIVFLPTPKGVSSSSFHKILNKSALQRNNIWVTHTENEFCVFLLIVNCERAQYKSVFLPKDGPAEFSMHPSGFVIQWFIADRKIEFRKINISWKFESLEETSRQAILYNPKIDYSNIRGIEQFLFPGAKYVKEQKSQDYPYKMLEIMLLFMIVLIIIFTYNVFVFLSPK